MKTQRASGRSFALLWLAAIASATSGAAAGELPGAAPVRLELVTGLAFFPGNAANADSFVRAATPDGRFLLVDSQSNNLAPGIIDVNSAPDVFVLDRLDGSFDLVSRRAGGPARSADGPLSESRGVALSEDGRWVLFESYARDLLAGGVFPGPPDARQIFLFDRATGATQLVSHAHDSAITAGDAEARAMTLSADGRYALFSSSAANLLAAGGSWDQVYLYDRDSGAHRLVSHRAAAAGLPGNGPALAADLSADGRYALFSSEASDLAAGQIDSQSSVDAFLFDRDTGAVELLSRDAASPLLAVGGEALDLTPDGRFVLLAAEDVDLGEGLDDGNESGRDVFLLERAAGRARLVSRSVTAGRSGNRGSFAHRASDDGRFVYFFSSADDLVDSFADRNGFADPDVYLFDAASGEVKLVSHTAGATAEGANAAVELAATRQSVSPDGRYALLASAAADLDGSAADANHALDRYLYDRSSGQTALVSRFSGSAEAGGAPFADADLVLGDGQVFFSSGAPLDPNAKDPRGQVDLFRFASGAAAVELVSATRQGGRSTLPYFPSVAHLGHNPRWAVWGPYLYDQLQGANERVGHPVGNPSLPANGEIYGKAVTADGRFVLYESLATDVAAGVSDANGGADLYLYDRAAAKASLLTHAAGSPLIAANGASHAPRMTSDGRFVAFDSSATDLVAGMSGAGATNVYLKDRAAGAISLISHAFAGPTVAGNGASALRAVDRQGGWVVYRSGARDLVAGFEDRNGTAQDLYFYDRHREQTRLITHRAGSLAEGSDATENPAYRALATHDGQSIFYTSAADDLVAGQVPRPGDEKIFRWDRATGANHLVVASGGAVAMPCGGSVRLADITGDGRWVLFEGTCQLVPGDTNGLADVYLLDRGSGQYTLISHPPGQPGVSLDVISHASDISEDGRRIVHLRDFSPYSYDREKGEATLLGFAYYDAGERAGSGESWPPDTMEASADGSRVLFGTYDANATPFDANGTLDFHLALLAGLFADGFESGDTAAWSLSAP